MASVAMINKDIAVAGLETMLEASGNLLKESSEMSSASTSILDLPVRVLQPIFRSACVDTQKRLVSGRIGEILGAQVECLTSVCTRWRDVVRSSFQHAHCESLENEDVALSQLHTLKNVTHVRVHQALTRKHERFLRGLATEFPLLMSFHLSFGGKVVDLEVLSLLLSLKTDIRELQLVLKNDSSYSTTWVCFKKALEDVDYTPLVHLKKLTLDFTRLANINFRDRLVDRGSIPVSRTLSQLAGLQELHIKVGDVAKMATLPPWLAELPAFVGLRIQFSEAPCSSFLDSLRKMTGLQELVITSWSCYSWHYEMVSRMSRLTSLELDGGWRTTETDVEGICQISVEPVCLASTLQKLRCDGEVLNRVTANLPLLEELTIEIAIKPVSEMTLLQRTPNVRSLHLELMPRKPVWPYLEHLAGLTFLSLNGSVFWRRDSEKPVWHICKAQVPALQVLVLHSCRLLRHIDGLLKLESHVAVSLRCECVKNWPWFSSHSEYVAGGSVCHRLPAVPARELFKDTRRLTPKPPGPCPACPAFRVPDPMDYLFGT